MTTTSRATRSNKPPRKVKGVGSTREKTKLARKGPGSLRVAPGRGPGRVERPLPPRPELNGLTASLIFTFWGDSDLTTMGQETMRLGRAMEGYDYKVLLKHNHTPSWIDLSEADERNADVVMPPTPDNFTDQFVALAQAGYIIDVYINAHGAPGSFTASAGTHSASPTSITEGRIRDLPEAAGLRSLPIRMVYQTHCWAESLNDAWRDAGAKVSTGARGLQFFPYQFGRFMTRWHDNETVRTANAEATTGTMRTLGQAYVLADAVAKRQAGEWGGCPIPKTVLGSSACAQEYFDYRWLRPGEWRAGQSGKQNMNWASTMVTAGSRDVRKNSNSLVW